MTDRMNTDALLDAEQRRSLPEQPSPAGPSVEAIVDLATQSPALLCAVYVYGSGPTPIVFRAPTLPEAACLAKRPLDDLYAGAAAAAGVEHVEFFPFATESGISGSVVFGFAAGTMANRDLLERVTNAIATSFEQATMLQHHAAISNRLQRALLPLKLPVAEGVGFDAAYRPATSESVVGGDWYDVFDIRPGIIGISIGDVTGHGLEAAVMMSEIRRAIRTAAAKAESPTDALNFVDTYMVSQNIGMATAILGYYDTQKSMLQYACAGHPHPVLVNRNGKPAFLPGGGLLLGIGMEKASPTWTVTLPPESLCYFYTDGLLEYGRDVIAGEIALLDAVERLARRETTAAEGLLDELFVESGNSDDAAVLLLARTSAPSDTMYLRYSAVPQSAMLVRDALRHMLGRHKVESEALFGILTGTGEAIANAIEHSSGDGACFEVTVTVSAAERLEIVVRSDGHWRQFTPRDERGRGIPMMRAYATRMNVETTSNATTVALIFEGIR